MQLEERFELALPPAAAWPAFGDIALLVGCLPGAALTGDAVDGDWPLRMDVKLGPIAASFAGQGRLSTDDSQHSGRFEGQASDRKTGSRVKGTAAFALAPQGQGTLVTVQVDYALTGALAQFGRGGIVRELAGALTAQFAARLQQRLTQQAEPASQPMTAGPASVTPVTATATAAAIPIPPSTPLSAGALLLQALRRWLRGLFNR